jgi:predicted NBD/HSP70 family sugar kinase
VKSSGLSPAESRHIGDARTVTILDDSAGFALGIDFGHGHLAIGVGDPNGRLLPRAGDKGVDANPIFQVEHVESDLDARAMTKAIARAACQQLRAVGISPTRVRAATISIPEPVSTTSRLVLSDTTMPQFVDQPIDALLREALGEIGNFASLSKVIVINHADVVVRGEARYGKGYGRRDVIAVVASTGIGAGVISNGQVVRNASGGGFGEIGHCVVSASNLETTYRQDEKVLRLAPIKTNRKCRCGHRTGHLETLASPDAVVDRLVESAGKRSVKVPPELLSMDNSKLASGTGSVLVRSASSYPACAAAIADSGRLLGRGVHSLINLFNPELVLVCGKLSEVGRPYLDAVKRGCTEQGRIGKATEIRLGSAASTLQRREIAVRGAIATALRNTDPLPLR